MSASRHLPYVYRWLLELDSIDRVLIFNRPFNNAGSMQDKTENALLPAIEGCGVQIKSLDDVIVKPCPY